MRFRLCVVLWMLFLAVVAAPAEAAFPGTNGRILAIRQSGYVNAHLVTFNPDGTGMRWVTTGPGWAAGARFSPDGRPIVFTRDGELFTVAATGDTPVQPRTCSRTPHTSRRGRPTGAGSSSPTWGTPASAANRGRS